VQYIGNGHGFSHEKITSKFTVFAILTASGTRLKKVLKSCFGAKFDNRFFDPDKSLPLKNNLLTIPGEIRR